MDQSRLEELLKLAAAQHQLISIAQSESVGVSQRTLEFWCDRGWFRPVRRGVVAIAGAKPSSWEPLMAAALAAGPDAVISHLAAAYIHRFYGIAPSRPELTVPRARSVRLSDVRVHSSQHLETADLEVRSGVLLTTPVRTVIDIAATTGDTLLGKILDEGTIRRLWTADIVAARLEQLGGAGRVGTVRLRRLLDYRRGEQHQDAQLEQRVFRVLTRAKPKIPDPVVHYRTLLGDRVLDMDLAWPEHRIDGEVDGYRSHSHWSDFVRDRRRGNLLRAHGWHLVQWISSMTDEEIVAEVRPYFGTS